MALTHALRRGTDVEAADPGPPRMSEAHGWIAADAAVEVAGAENRHHDRVGPVRRAAAELALDLLLGDHLQLARRVVRVPRREQLGPQRLVPREPDGAALRELVQVEVGRRADVQVQELVPVGEVAVARPPELGATL